MDEKTTGATPGGKRTAPGGKGKLPAVIGGGVVAVLLAGYLGLCAAAGGGDTLPAKTSAAGVDLSGLTTQQAMDKITEAISAQGRQITFREPTSGAQVVFDATGGMEAVPIEGESGPSVPFLARGARLLSRLISGGDELDFDVRLTDAGAAQLSDLLAQLTRQAGVSGNETTWELTDSAIVFTKGVTGKALDMEAARQSIGDALNGEGTVEVTIVEAPPAEPDLEAIHAQVFSQPVNAALDKTTGDITEGEPGKDFDVETARTLLAGAGEGATVEVPLTLTQPDISAQTLRASLFKDVLGSASTKISGTSVRKNNVKTAGNYFNGTILLPGEVFNYYNVAGPFSVERGYGLAPAYVGGKSENVPGGGICQGSSTLYWACLKANLEIVERHPHGYVPSYIPAGLDATVSGGGPNYQFKNDTEYPIKLEAYTDSKWYLHVNIYGTDTTGIHGEPYSKNVVVTEYAKTVYEPNSSIPPGTTRKDDSRTAYNATSAEAYQKLVDKNGNVISEFLLHKDRYKKRDAVIFYNPDDAAVWGINPNTGLKTETPVAPVEDPEGGTDVPGVDPGQTGETTTDPGTEVIPTADPGGVVPPPGEELTPAVDPGAVVEPPAPAVEPGGVVDPVPEA